MSETMKEVPLGAGGILFVPTEDGKYKLIVVENEAVPTIAVAALTARMVVADSIYEITGVRL